MEKEIGPKIVFSNGIGTVLFWCQRKERQIVKELCLSTYFKKDRKCRACLGLKPRKHWPEPWNKPGEEKV